MRQTYEETETLKLHILEKAKEVFCREGYEKAKMQDIAEAAQVSRGPLYYHYANKLELFNKVLDSICEERLAFAQETFGRNDISFLEKIRFNFEFCVSKELLSFDSLSINLIGSKDPQFLYAQQRLAENLTSLYDVKYAAAMEAKACGELREDTDISSMLGILFSAYGIFAQRRLQSSVQYFNKGIEIVSDQELLDFLIRSFQREFFY